MPNTSEDAYIRSTLLIFLFFNSLFFLTFSPASLFNWTFLYSRIEHRSHVVPLAKLILIVELLLAPRVVRQTCPHRIENEIALSFRYRDKNSDTNVKTHATTATYTCITPQWHDWKKYVRGRAQCAWKNLVIFTRHGLLHVECGDEHVLVPYATHSSNRDTNVCCGFPVQSLRILIGYSNLFIKSEMDARVCGVLWTHVLFLSIIFPFVQTQNTKWMNGGGAGERLLRVFMCLLSFVSCMR